LDFKRAVGGHGIALRLVFLSRGVKEDQLDGWLSSYVKLTCFFICFFRGKLGSGFQVAKMREATTLNRVQGERDDTEGI
jgi:hypothetical protein